jgi:hypothetical protein
MKILLVQFPPPSSLATSRLLENSLKGTYNSGNVLRRLLYESRQKIFFLEFACEYANCN